jgi:hypothetical protein
VEAPRELIARIAGSTLAVLLVFALGSLPAFAQDEHDAPPPAPARPSNVTIAKFLAGAALGLGLHESGHTGMALTFDAHPHVEGLSFGPIPFFALTHRDVSPAREYAISAAGFWMQAASSEWILTTRPDLRHERAPVAKGVLAFHVLASTVYAVAAVAEIGPYERDTRSMAAALRIKEGWVGALVIAPAALDLWRYRHPESTWARWASRAAKVGMVLAVVRAAE